MTKTLRILRIISLLYSFLLIIFILNACTEPSKKVQDKRGTTLFTLLDNNNTNIHFTNKVTENLYFNFLNYPYIYNGGGIAVGDINNDGLEDLYFTSNQGSNKLYLNQGGFKFKDITITANVVDNKGWSTGVTMIDINNDGWLDIYISKSGSLDNHELRKNKLYINQKNNTFKESASEYGLDFYGFSVQSYFFDMDNDGDLDMYLVNHRVDFRNNITLDLARDKQIEDYGSDQLFRNDNGKFINITNVAGVANKAWGLSASIGDFNNDGWLDVYVANDFFHPDYLYINNKNGTFTDEAETRFKHISNNSMGSDFADINNDLQPDLIVLDMMAEDHIRGKKNMAAMNTNSFNMMVNAGYHHQYMSNVLQLNRGNGTYSEIGQLAGIAKTDWSWAPLIADFDNDGFKDIFITNGIDHDLSNQDFRDQMRQNIMNRKKVSLEDAIAMMPSEKLQNYFYKNNGDLTFKKVSSLWGITQKVNSNGTVYSDLDNDGDLDLVVNNQADAASIYKNNSTNNTINFVLRGAEQNRNGIGTKIYVYTDSLQQFKEHFTSRGYQSSTTHKIHFGVRDNEKIDSILVIWSDGLKQVLKNEEVNKTIIFNHKNAKKSKQISIAQNSLFEEVDPKEIGINYIQKENTFNDLDLQLLLPQKQSEINSALAVADINKDGLEDFFVGNARGSMAVLYIQKNNGTFYQSNQHLFDSEKEFEDTDAHFFDADNDGDIDLYVTSGGYELKKNSPFLQDRIYINNGKGQFKKSNKLPEMLSYTKGITSADFDKDCDLDIFVGSRVISGKYPLSNPSYLLENQNGKFVNVTKKKIPAFSEMKMVNDAIFTDFDNDGDDDLLVVGEWMPILIFENNNGQFTQKKLPVLEKSNGWQQSIKEIDINNDGFKDYIIGNWGENNKFHPTKEKPLHIYADYFDDNTSFDIALSKISKGKLVPVRGRECSTQQTPFLKEKITKYSQFANASMDEIYGEEKLKNATHYIAYNFSSILLKNKGDGHFEIKKLPNQAQFGPTLDIEVYDFNNDRYLDVFGIGNVYDAEVETIRYDASKGFILFGDEKGNYQFNNDISYFNDNEAKAVKKIHVDGVVHFIILNKNNQLKILKIN